MPRKPTYGQLAADVERLRAENARLKQAVQGRHPETRDITARKEAEDRLKEASKQLEKSVERRTAELARTNRELDLTLTTCVRGMDLMEVQRDLAVTLASMDNLLDGLKISLSAALKASGMDGGGIYLFDEDTGTLNLMVHQGLSKAFVNNEASYGGSDPRVKLVRAGVTVYGIEPDSQVMQSEAVAREGLKSLAVVPLADPSGVLGCINLASRSRAGFSESARIAVETMAAFIGQSIAHLNVKASLRSSQAHLNSLLMSASGFAVYRLVRDESTPRRMRTVFVSPSVEDLLGIPPERFDFETLFANTHPDDLQRIEAANESAFSTQQFDQILRFRHARKSDWIWIHAISRGVPEDAGNMTHVNGIIIDITGEQTAREELKVKAGNLEELNAALRILLRKREEDKTEVEEKVIFSVRELIDPYVEKLKNSGLKTTQKLLVEIVRSNLDEIIAPFAFTLVSRFIDLTPREIEIAGLIKQGRTSKEMATVMGISPRTVDTHRRRLRAKMGFRHKKGSLRTHLLALD